MVTITGTPVPFRLPTRTEVREAMTRSTSVLITMIVCVTAVVLATLGALVYLAVTGKSAEVLVAAVVGPLVGALVSLVSRVKAVEKAVDANPALPSVTKE